MDHTTKLQASEHPIKSVTVFKSSKAEVVRTFVHDLEAGQNKIEIVGLPSCIDTESARVSGLGDARLFDVVCVIADKPASSYDGSSETIRILEAKKVYLVKEKLVRGQEAEVMLTYGKSLQGEHVTPDTMTTFLDSFVLRGRKNLQAVSELEEKIVEIDRQIEKEQEKTTTTKGESNGKVTIVIAAENEGQVELKLTYIVTNANWEPTYDLHASTVNGKPASAVSLQYRARITQSTGEDWKDTSLTLSTSTSDTITKGIPELKPVKIKPPQPMFGAAGCPPPSMGAAFLQQRPQQQQMLLAAQRQLQLQQQQQQNLVAQPTGFALNRSLAAPAISRAPPDVTTRAAAESSDDELDEDLISEFAELAGPGALTEPTTIVNVSPLAISYRVEGKASIPSDGEAHQVSVAILPFDAKVTHVTVPRVSAVAYLQCEVKNTSDYRLLPGPVSVFLDESYVSKTSIQDVNTGDTFECPLGADSSLRISHARIPRTVRDSASAFAEQFKSTTYTVTTTIRNKHRFAISELVVRDVIPLVDDKRVKVILRKPQGLAEAKGDQEVMVKDKDKEVKIRWSKVVDKKGGAKEGKYEWLCKLEANGEINLVTEYEVKSPADLNWIESW
ncbi:hypothetical protein JAAARDRAFT_127570 [Jaapia argillacea MUCL 33604]|uniref:DUF4139 domain-containing protein n=1 Tax=Jaapia argillacea MUCL 33604 TaxID=933084 RepID=A0A067PWD8_9AGAM|nr:hypothetical protein JAAARDRAFT_127570 [Jaapia argillacea MUCL 33604]